MKKYLLKGFITTTLGLIIMIADVLFFFGYIHLPEPGFVPKSIEIGIAFIVGLVLFLMPQTYIEHQLKEFISKKNK